MSTEDEDAHSSDNPTSGLFAAGEGARKSSARTISTTLTSEGGEVDEETDEGPYTDEEIRTQLEALGYRNIPDYQLRLFKEDLEALILHDHEKRRRKPKSVSGFGSSRSEESGRKKSTRKLVEPFSTYKDKKFPGNRGRSPSPPSSDSSRSTQNPRWHRRKVLRHFRGEPIICEEPGETDTDLTILSDRVSSLPLDDSESEPPQSSRHRPPTWGRDCPIVNACVCKKSPSQRSSATSTAVRKRIQRGVYYDEIIRYLPKSFVESQPLQPVKKMNPHQRYDMYRRMWSNCRIPGETPDQELRWCIRALLLTRKVPEVEVYALKRKDAIEKARNRRQNRS